jgi:hypothetical protein
MPEGITAITEASQALVSVVTPTVEEAPTPAAAPTEAAVAAPEAAEAKKEGEA